MFGRVRTAAVVMAVTALLAVGGCGIDVSASGGAPIDLSSTDSPTDPDTPATTPAGPDTPATTPANQAAPRPSAKAGAGSVRDAGDIPDVCALLTESEVVALTGRRITQVDTDGAKPGDTTRYCQWQQFSGQLAVFLSRTSQSDFTTRSAEAEPVSGVGEDAYLLSGHLLVLAGTVMVDVYVRGGSDAENLTVAKTVTRALLPKI